jgi:type I site-specific restriction endonuclease
VSLCIHSDTAFEPERFIVGRFGKLQIDPLAQTFHRGEHALRYYQNAAIKKILEAFLKGQKKY